LDEDENSGNGFARLIPSWYAAMVRSSFEGMVSVVAGGSSGIGRAVGLALAKAGATVVFAGRDEKALESVVSQARAGGANAFLRVVDVRDPASVEEAVVYAIKVGGKLDLMFNGAGTALLAYAEDTTLALHTEVIAVNLMGAIHGIHAAYTVMKQQGHGHIVNVASLAGIVPLPASTAYCASKFGVVGLSMALRLEAAEFGVNVSVVCPAAVKTPLFDRATYVRFDGQRIAANPPPGGFMSAEECARNILDGVRLNRGLITPGRAGTVAALYRHFPGLWGFAMKRMTKALREARITEGPGTNAAGSP
jgi:NAD(P)-dependent dehydrogenase (short-subunit alcohol dehydrogenase family)